MVDLGVPSAQNYVRGYSATDYPTQFPWQVADAKVLSDAKKTTLTTLLSNSFVTDTMLQSKGLRPTDIQSLDRDVRTLHAPSRKLPGIDPVHVFYLQCSEYALEDLAKLGGIAARVCSREVPYHFLQGSDERVPQVIRYGSLADITAQIKIEVPKAGDHAQKLALMGAGFGNLMRMIYAGTVPSSEREIIFADGYAPVSSLIELSAQGQLLYARNDPNTAKTLYALATFINSKLIRTANGVLHTSYEAIAKALKEEGHLDQHIATLITMGVGYSLHAHKPLQAVSPQALTRFNGAGIGLPTEGTIILPNEGVSKLKTLSERPH